MSANDKTSVGQGREDWRTPGDLFDRLNDLYAFNYDACADHSNALCDRYSTVAGTFVRGVPFSDPPTPHKVSDADALAYDWRALRVFINPPYCDSENPCRMRGDVYTCDKARCRNRGYHIDEYKPGIVDFAAKCAAERNNARIIVGVFPAATDTNWWHDYIAPYAVTHFLRGRVRFINPVTGEPGDSPPGGMAIVVWLPDWLSKGAQ